MRLSDVMSNAGLQGWATAGLVLAALAFAGVLLAAGLMSKRSVERAARLPLDDESGLN
jgi:hypothetical protein